MTSKLPLSASFRGAKGDYVALVLLIAAMVRVSLTFAVFTQTHDEPFHVLRGMHWVHSMAYVHVEHPPLAPIAFAIGPTLMGCRWKDSRDKHSDGNSLLYENGDYFRVLTSARMGNLLFLGVATCALFFWVRSLYGPNAAAVATGLFTTAPPILAHAGLATTDLAIVATMLIFILALQRLIRRPSVVAAVVCGICLGLVLLSKFTAGLFVPVTLVSIGLCASYGRESRITLQALLCGGGAAIVCVGIALAVVWLGYRGSFGTMQSALEAERRAVGHSLPPSLARLPIPAPEFAAGVYRSQQKIERGHAPYFLGSDRSRAKGSWLFFPVVFAIKTPIPLLLLFPVGVVCAVRRFRQDASWLVLVPVMLLVAVLVSLLPVTVNLGIRHALLLYPLAAALAGCAVVDLCSAPRARLLLRGTVWLLVLWQAADSLASHPDHLAYFNELARKRPDRFVVDSDLDWGQDLARLSDEARTRNIGRLHIAYFGTADVARHGLPDFTVLRPGEPATGWVAVSVTLLRAARGYEWLNDYEPVATVGRSIRLYYIDAVTPPPASCRWEWASAVYSAA